MENIENKSLKSFILSNKKILTSFIGILFFLIIFFWWTDNNSKKERYKNSEDFISAKVLLSQQKEKKSLEILKKIISKNDEVYSPLSLFVIIDKDLEKSREKILKYFDQIISIKGLDKEDLNLLKLKKAIFIAENTDEKNLLELLNPILNSDSVWRYESLKLLGDYYFDKNEYKKAKQYYSDILKSENSNMNRNEISRKINIIEND